MKSPMSPLQRRGAYVALSRLLSYPDRELIDDLPLLRLVVDGLPADVGDPLRAYLSTVESRTLLGLQEHYVSIFDMKRRCCLYLSYYLNGDTRRRGMALWRFQETYQRAGWVITNGELADYLPMLLEFAASGADEESVAVTLLQEHREGLEVLITALRRFDSDTHLLVGALLRLLPELTVEQIAAANLLIAQGPPAELVGLEPFSAQPTSMGART